MSDAIRQLGPAVDWRLCFRQLYKVSRSVALKCEKASTTSAAIFSLGLQRDYICMQAATQ